MALPAILSRWASRIGLKQAEGEFIPTRGTIWYAPSGGLARTSYSYATDVGDGLGSSVIMPVIQFMQRAFPEAPLVVRQRVEDELEIVPQHPLAALIERPNPFYPGTLLWMATILDWCWAGEAYWRVIREAGGRPAQLWWLPPWTIEPKWPSDGSVYISHYEYHPNGQPTQRFALDEVLHFRHGLDPRTPRHGLPPLRAALRDVWSDDESANWVASLLRNMAIPGMIVSPRAEEGVIGPEDVERIKLYVHSRFAGDHRGEPLVFGRPTIVDRLAWSPREMDMRVVRDLAEARVCAALGIPAAVVGFNSGMDTTRVGATMQESVRLAWNNGIIPVQRLLAAELQRVLLPQFEANAEAFLVGWDYDEVQALETDQNALAKRAVELYQGGVLMRSEARQLMGYEANEGDEIYLVPASMTEEGPDAPELEPTPAPAVPGMNGNGNGSSPANGNGARNGAVATREAKQGTLDEWVNTLIGRTARRVEHPPRTALVLGAKLWRQQVAVQKRFEPLVRRVFERYAEAAGTAARELLKPEKASVENVIRTAILHERLPLAQIKFELEGVYRELYAEMLELLVKALGELDHPEFTDPTRVLRQIQMAAAPRVGLLDLTTEARTNILTTLEKATQSGLSEDEMIAAIRDALPRGRWLSIDTRAEILVRTESRYAMNLAAAGYARDQGLRMLVLDAQLGPTDEVCEARVGWIVTPAQAEQLAATEHPNGTFAAIPMPSGVEAFT